MGSLLIDNVTKSFGETDILKGINIDIQDGEFLILVGPSGCGKSTLMNIIAGLEDATSGTLELAGKDVTLASPKDRDIAMVFQSYALYPTMNVARNISFGLEMRKVPKEERDRIVNEVAKLLQIDHLLDRKPSQLSGGQRQRVAMGRALARSPRVFLFDEPLSNLDAKLRVEMRTEIKKLHKRLGTTIVYVTHDQIEAMTLADRIAIMRGGKIMQLSSPDEIYNKPKNKYVADFIGSPSMNFFEGDLKGGTFTKGDLSVPMEGYDFITAHTTDCRAIFGVRPEHIVTGELVTRAPVQASVTIDLVEPMGSDTLVYAKLAGENFRIRMDGQAKVKIGDQLRVGIDPTRASLFDAATENRL